MKKTVIQTLGFVVGAVFSLISASALAAGFPAGQLLVADSSTIYLVDPAAGASNRIVTGLSGLGDVVYNPVSDSAFAVAGSSIIEIRATPNGYSTSSFITGVSDLACLAVDAFGRIIFNQQDFVDHALWRAELDGSVSILTGPEFFVPNHMAFSKDFSKLYVFESPMNDVAVVSFPSGTVSTLASGLDFPTGGDVDPAGNVYVLEDFSTAKITRIAPSGSRTTYAAQSWMNFVYDDMVYDGQTGVIYVTSTSGLYALNPDLTYRRLMQGSGWFVGLDMVRPGAPIFSQQPQSVVVARGGTAIFSVVLNGGGTATYQWRHNGTNLPGATGPSLTIANVGPQDTGAYSVFVISAGGAAISAEAALTILDFSVNPVVSLSGPVGARYQLQFTEDLQSTNTWYAWTNVTATSTFMDVVDHTATGSPRRFYRVLPVP